MGLGQFLGDLEYEVLTDLIYIHSTVISYIPVLNPGNTVVNTTDKVPALIELGSS